MNVASRALRFALPWALGLVGAAGWPAAAQAQSADYPNHPVRIISPHSPGMGTDSALRGMAQILTTTLGQPFVIENRPGADGVIAGEACARAPADGYTLCMGDSLGIMLSPLIRLSMPYEPSQAFAPVALMSFIPGGIWVNSALPVNSFEQLLSYAASHPGRVNIGTFGRASPPYLYSQLLAATKGIRFNEVPYKSSGDAWRALLAGEVDVTTYTIGAGLKQAQSRGRLVAVSTSSRVAEAPEVPTYQQIGLQPVTSWIALFAPAATPRPIIERINAELAKGFYANPDMLAKFIDAPGYVVQGAAGKPVADVDEFMKQQRSMYVGLIEAARIPRE